MSEQKQQERSDQEEMRQRVLYTMFLPAVRMAALFRVPLSQMKKLLETSYYHETQRHGMSMQDAMKVMSVSISKAALLSKQLKTSFMQADREYGTPRRIEYTLWAGPLSFSRMAQVLGDVERELLRETLEALIAEGKVEVGGQTRREPLYQLVQAGQDRRVWKSWLARIDGLDRALDSVTKAIHARFFRMSPKAFARTITFHVRPEDSERLKTFYEEALFPLLAELDQAANENPDNAELVNFSVFWSPDSFEDDDKSSEGAS